MTFLARLQENTGSDGNDLNSLVGECLGAESSQEKDWICSSIHSVVELHFEVESCRRHLRMPLILTEDAFIEDLREGAAFRALRRVGILARLNRIVEEAMESVLSGTMALYVDFAWIELTNALRSHLLSPYSSWA